MKKYIEAASLRIVKVSSFGGTERILLIDVFPKGDKISLKYYAHLLKNLKYAAKWKSGEELTDEILIF